MLHIYNSNDSQKEMHYEAFDCGISSTYKVMPLVSLFRNSIFYDAASLQHGHIYVS